jgi:hypothetical protein
MYTPPEAMKYIMDYLPKDWIYWEMCYGKWHMANELIKNWFNVIGNEDIDCFDTIDIKSFDCIITNPPFNWNKKFIKRAIELQKPFAFLIRLEHLWWVEAMNLLKDLNIQIIIPQKRINYITPKMMNWEKVWGSQFHSIWLTYKLWLNKQINYR